MRYNFSANFLKVQEPDTNFGQAWEGLCFDLLLAEYNDSSQIRLKAPDKGIDIYRQSIKTAYQCKSCEIAILGNIDANDCINSIESALKVRDSIIWDKYYIATNSNFTGTSFQKLQDYLKENRIKNVQQLGPEYWSGLCEKHIENVQNRLDYRLTLTEEQVIDAFRKAQYYDKFINEYAEKIKSGNYLVDIKNNRTPIILKIPFSPELTIENLLDVISSILNIKMDWNNYYDTKTSAGPSISITFEGSKQTFSRKISEVAVDKTPQFEFWITIAWKDETKKDTDESTKTMTQFLTMKELSRDDLTLSQRKDITIKRTESILQTMMWNGILNLKNN